MAQKTSLSSKSGTSHTDQLRRLKRVEGQIRGIIKMVEEKRYCMDILQQLKATKSALAAVELNIIDGHLNHCAQKAVLSRQPGEAQQIVDEMRELLRRSTRS